MEENSSRLVLIFITAFFAVIIITSLLGYNSNNDIDYIFYFWGYYFYSSVACSFVFIVFMIVTQNINESYFYNEIIFAKLSFKNENLIKEIFVFIISPNYFWVDFYKKVIETIQLTSNYKILLKRKILRANFVERLNGYNIVFSIILFFIVLFIGKINSPPLEYIFIGFYVYRAFSRSFEIIIAFGKDALERNNETGLNKFDRIKLAIISYFEILINYTTVYYLLFFDQRNQMFDAFSISIKINTLIAIPNFINNNVEIFNINKLLMYLQIISVLTIVLLALAMYVSDFKKK